MHIWSPNDERVVLYVDGYATRKSLSEEVEAETVQCSILSPCQATDTTTLTNSVSQREIRKQQRWKWYPGNVGGLSARW